MSLSVLFYFISIVVVKAILGRSILGLVNTGIDGTGGTVNSLLTLTDDYGTHADDI